MKKEKSDFATETKEKIAKKTLSCKKTIKSYLKRTKKSIYNLPKNLKKFMHTSPQRIKKNLKWSIKNLKIIKKEDPKLTGVILAMALTTLTIIAMTVMISINNGGFSIFIDLDKEMKSSNEESKYVGDLFGEDKAVVYYPQLEGMSGTNFRLAASKILFNIDDYQGQIKVDYELTNYNDKYIGVEYKDVEGDNTFFYTVDGKKVSNKVFDDFLRQQIIMETRAYAKQNEEFKDYAHTIEFATVTANEEIPYRFTITGNNINIIYDDFYKGERLQFSMELNEVSDHIDLDLGVEQVNPAMKAKSPARYVDPNRPMVALTFDDGPFEPNTRMIMEALYEVDGAATFYMLGQRVSIESEHDVIIDLVNYGNEIGGHSMTHDYLPELTKTKYSEEAREAQAKKLNWELYGVQDAVKEITGGYVAETYRPPYGGINSKVLIAGEFPFIFWTVDTLDWKTRDSTKIYNYVMKTVKDGDIVLLHDLHKETAVASEDFIRDLKEKGFQLVTVSELMEAKGVTMQDHKIYGW